LAIPTPEQHFGFQLGSERKLARWPKIVEYFELLDAGSPRLKLEHLGETTDGRPFIAAAITSAENMSRLDELRQIQARLADPRGLDDAEAGALVGRAKTIVMISCSIHASEVGGTQMSSELAYELCTGEDEVTRQVLDNVVFLFVPCLNPDGLEMVAGYYEETIGKPWEGGPMPWLYHKYVGHDNNRDWFMLTQVENQLTVEKVHNVWHPMIVHDQHQMSPFGFRMFLPPYIDPFDPNVDPLLQHETTVLGASMMMELLQAGKTGVTSGIIFDCFSPSRAYQHYHGGVRILSEMASCRTATSMEIAFKDLQPGRDGSDPKVASVNQPSPWPGGAWSLREIVDYDKIAAWACLKHAARYRDMWVRNFLQIGRNSLAVKKPYAFVVPAGQPDPVSTYEMLHTLERGMVEIQTATEPFVAGGITYAAGTRVILTAQPYGRYAKTLLERQVYPDLRVFPGGPPKPPYDITAHTLPLQMGVKCVQVEASFEAKLAPAKAALPRVVPEGTTAKARGEHGFLLCPAMNASFRAVNRLIAGGFEVHRICTPAGPAGHEIPGAFWAAPKQGLAGALEELTALGIRTGPANPAQLAGAPTLRLRRPRLGLYRSYTPNADEGWTRFIFDDYGFPYETLLDPEVKAGNLDAKYDTIVVPAQAPGQVREGFRRGWADPRYAGGLGEDGRQSLRDFVLSGGTLVCLGGACDYAADALGLRVQNVLQALKPEEFYLPGSMLRALFDIGHPVAYGMPAEATVLHVQSPAFEVREGTVVGRYPPTSVLQSGWILGEQYVQDRACVAEVRFGRGRVILLGPRVQFRAQTRGTYKLLFNSIYYGSADEVRLP